MVNGQELCKNLGRALLNVGGICSTLGESAISLVNLVGSYLNSSYNNNGILLGMVLTVLIQKRDVLYKLQYAGEKTVAEAITSLYNNLDQLSGRIQSAGVGLKDILIDYLSAGPLIEGIGDKMTGDYKQDLEKVQKIDSKLREKRKADLETLFDAANAEAAIREMLNEQQTPAQEASVHEDGSASQRERGGRRSRRRTKRRGTKSKRKHTKKRTKRRRKHSRSTKKRHRVSKMKKRKTKRRRKMRGGGKWGTGSCPGDFTSEGSKTGDTPPPPAETRQLKHQPRNHQWQDKKVAVIIVAERCVVSVGRAEAEKCAEEESGERIVSWRFYE